MVVAARAGLPPIRRPRVVRVCEVDVAAHGTTPSDAPPLALRCAGLVKRFPGVEAVRGVDLEVFAGECFGLLGPNGAGKTTTVEILEGLTRADGGTVEVLGQRWGEGDDRALRQRFGVQLQQTILSGKLTVRETVRLFRSFYRRGLEVEETIAMVGLQEKAGARVAGLSGGQTQRLSLACALVADPELLFLDEPTTGLDPQGRLKVWEVVERFLARGRTVVLTTHYMEEAQRLCQRVAIMDHGRIIALDTPARLVASLGAEQVIELRLDGDIAAEELRALPGIDAVTSRDGDLLLSVRDVATTLPALLAELDRRTLHLESLTTHEATLDDVFVHLTGRELRDG